MTYNDFVNTWSNHGADFDGSFGNQCVDLFNYYNRDVVGGDFIWCDGAFELWDNIAASSDKYNRVSNTPDGVPPVGSVVIWRSNGIYTGPAGHVGIATGEGDTSYFVSFDQNWPTYSLPHPQRHDYNDVIGWYEVKATPVVPVEAPVVPEAPVTPLEVPVVITQEPVVVPSTEAVPTGSTETLPHKVDTSPTKAESQPIITVSPGAPMNDLKSRLTSRKFWVAVISAILFALHGDINQSVAVVIGYLGVQAYVDSSK